MSKMQDDIETLKRWANWVLNNPHEFGTMHFKKMWEYEREAASAVLNLISLVGTQQARLDSIERQTLERAAWLCESQEDFCCGGATRRCASLLRKLIKPEDPSTQPPGACL